VTDLLPATVAPANLVELTQRSPVQAEQLSALDDLVRGFLPATSADAR
jgi:hypothetical protein